MSRLKIMTVFGTRPEAVKMAPLVLEIQKNKNMTCVVCVTAQHREMLDQALRRFRIQPDYDLNLMRHGQTLSDITCGALTGLEEVIEKEQPDLILVHGDTTTAFSAALAGFYHKCSIGHIEAGLRTYDRYQPWPEEMNRKMLTALCNLHFAPTDLAEERLLLENVDPESIYVTGNTVIDALQMTVMENYRFQYDFLNQISYGERKVIAMTAHRRENLGEPLEQICRGVLHLVEDYEDLEVVYAVHSNPQVQETAKKILGGKERIHLTPPLDMEDMHNLISRSFLVLTDSGGLQEEAPSMDVPVLVLREVTERPEGALAGTLMLAGTSENGVYEKCRMLLEDEALYKKMAATSNPFGDGKASWRIVQGIEYAFGRRTEKPNRFKA